MKSSVSAIILCGGSGERCKANKNKVLMYFGVKTALEYCLDAFAPFADDLIVVYARNDKEEVEAIAKQYGAICIEGGNTRTESVKNGLSAVSGKIVLIHDGARPFADKGTIERCIVSAQKHGSGIAAVKVSDTVKRIKDGVIINEIPRDDLYYMQTPQAFIASEIKAAYDNAEGTFNDDSAVYMAAGRMPHIVESSASNKKITYPEDLISTPPCQRIGTGVDFHTFEAGRKLILGGVQIPFGMGLVGNSDADALVHAIMDALLSAIDEPDIGVLFPCTDEYKDANSMELLKTVKSKVSAKGYSIANVSAAVMAQAPKLQSYIPLMRTALSDALNIPCHCVNVSATTTEGLGIIGEGKGIAASAVCLLQKNS